MAQKQRKSVSTIARHSNMSVQQTISPVASLAYIHQTIPGPRRYHRYPDTFLLFSKIIYSIHTTSILQPGRCGISIVAIHHRSASDDSLDQSRCLAFTITYNTLSGRLQRHCHRLTMALCSKLSVSESHYTLNEVSPKPFINGPQFDNAY